MSSSAKYQRHIDGLRAVAVLCVVFYHFGLTSFSGGFVGVDVFFVISGYLITDLISTELMNTGNFSFRRFYIRRIRRLLPALFVTLLLSLLLAVALFSPERFQGFGRSLSAAVFSVSNVLFWLESGYFDTESHLKPLLHTWSLGVEEQFYLLWPALLWLSCRIGGRGSLIILLAIVGGLSFTLNYLWVTGNFDAEFSSTIFYLTPFRIFELTIGAIAALTGPLAAGRRWAHELAMLLGLAMIAYAVSTYTGGLVFPYYNALLPCCGALLVILSRESRVFSWPLTNPVAVGIGLISYSLYLVHWPALVFLKYYLFTPLSSLHYTLLFGFSLILSTLMYFGVEKPLRRNSPTASSVIPQRRFLLVCLALTVALGLTGAYIATSQGNTWTNAGSMPADVVAEGMKGRFKLIHKGCNLNTLDDPKRCQRNRPHQILIIGNSHEPDGYNIFSHIYRTDSTVNLISFGSLNRCQIDISGAKPTSAVRDRHCRERVHLLSDPEFVASLAGVIYSANKPFSSEEPGNKEVSWHILNHLRQFKPQLPLIVLGGYINTTHNCSELFNRFGTFAACKDARYVSYNPFLERSRSAVPQAQESDYLYIDKAQLLCSTKSLDSCTIEANGEPAFYDKHHLSLGFATHLANRISDVYRQDINRQGFPPVPMTDTATQLEAR